MNASWSGIDREDSVSIEKATLRKVRRIRKYAGSYLTLSFYRGHIAIKRTGIEISYVISSQSDLSIGFYAIISTYSIVINNR